MNQNRRGAFDLGQHRTPGACFWRGLAHKTCAGGMQLRSK